MQIIAQVTNRLMNTPRCTGRMRSHLDASGLIRYGSIYVRRVKRDGYAASHRAVREMKIDGQLPADTKVRSSKYLNNLIEQDHRGVKLRIGPMLGFEWFTTATITIGGDQLLRRDPQRPVRPRPIGASKIELRLPSGTRCWQRNKIVAFWTRADLQLKLHQNHHFHQVAVTEFETQIPPHTQDDDLAVKVAALEQLIQTFRNPAIILPQLIGMAEYGRVESLHQSRPHDPEAAEHSEIDHLRFRPKGYTRTDPRLKLHQNLQIHALVFQAAPQPLPCFGV